MLRVFGWLALLAHSDRAKDADPSGLGNLITKQRERFSS